VSSETEEEGEASITSRGDKGGKNRKVKQKKGGKKKEKAENEKFRKRTGGIGG